MLRQSKTLRSLALSLSAVALAACEVKSEQVEIDDEDYAAAAALDNAAQPTLVRNASILPHWIDGEDRFWYKRDTKDGAEIIIIDALTEERRTAYDMKAMRASLLELAGEAAANAVISPIMLTTVHGRLKVTFLVDGKNFLCDAKTAVCEVGAAATPPAPNLLVAPNRARAVFIRDHNLWLRELVSDAEMQLTKDGEAFAAYGAPADLSRLEQSLNDIPDGPPVSTHWSPDGRILITRRLDERAVPSYPFIESVPRDGSFRPRIHEVKIALLGDAFQARSSHLVIDALSGETRPIHLPEGFDLDDLRMGNRPIGWSDDSRYAYLYASTIDGQTGRVIELDVHTGETTRTILEEYAPDSRVTLSSSLMTPPIIRIIGDDIVWYSERSGWGHLYLYNLRTGERMRALTGGDWAVHSIVHVNESDRTLIIAAMGREEGADPYWRRLYRVPLNGGAPELLTPEDANHTPTPNAVSPSGNYIVQAYSTLSQPPRTVLRSVDRPTEAVEVETADATVLYATGWRPPERVRVKAADDETDLYAIVYSPSPQYSNSLSVPVIEANYMNSIFAATPVDFMSTFQMPFTSGLSRLGFYVVMVDGRGTPLRSRAFREEGYPDFYDIQIEDHVAAISQIAVHYPRMDLTRVGIFGHSNGGSGAARAILRRPDFYTVAVASAGSHDYMSLPPSGVKFFGAPVYFDGSSIKPSPNAIPENYKGFDNAALAENLSGRLLLAYGDMDLAALPSATLRLANALSAAGKHYDLLYMPNHGHHFLYDPYFADRLRAYFVEHLHASGPPL